MVQPVYFGQPDRTLFGVTHGLPNPGVSGVVVAPPLFQEAIATHRALWSLGEHLAASGVPALRFDWYGSGDSGGQASQMTLDGLAGDVRAAMAWWNASMASPLRILALRSGALGVMAAARQAAVPLDLVLWDPPASGEKLLAGWREMHRRQLSEAGRYPFAPGRPAEDDLLGFDPSPAFLAEMEAFRLENCVLPAGSRVLVASWREDPEVRAWTVGLEAADVRTQWLELDASDAPAWDDPGQFESQIFPRRAAATLAQRLTGRV
ncbi:MAG: hypothetical protein QM761_04875 [Pseudoxanthomonas sp.]